MKDQPKKGAPAWMVSFGDMMTLILTFFILLVSMSREQHIGLVAAGVSSFIAELRSFGMPGVLDGNERVETFDEIRRRFNLPPEDDPDRRADPEDASRFELLRAEVAEALEPHDELAQPSIAVFAEGSAAIDDRVRRYLDLLAPTLRPEPGQVLVLEGHAGDADGARAGGRARLAFARADAVRRHLVEEHGFPAERVEARAWLTEIYSEGTTTRSVDARLITPASAPRR